MLTTLRWVYPHQLAIRRWWYRSQLRYHRKQLRISIRCHHLRLRLHTRCLIPKRRRNRLRLLCLHHPHQPMWRNHLPRLQHLMPICIININNHRRRNLNFMCNHHWYLRFNIQPIIMHLSPSTSYILNCCCHLRIKRRNQPRQLSIRQWINHLQRKWWYLRCINSISRSTNLSHCICQWKHLHHWSYLIRKLSLSPSWSKPLKPTISHPIAKRLRQRITSCWNLRIRSLGNRSSLTIILWWC